MLLNMHLLKVSMTGILEGSEGFLAKPIFCCAVLAFSSLVRWDEIFLAPATSHWDTAVLVILSKN